jgi:hypothetical protein
LLGKELRDASEWQFSIPGMNITSAPLDLQPILATI